MTISIPSVAAPETIELEPADVREGADSGYPEISVKEISSANGIDVGVWECTPGGWPIENRPNTEVCFIVSGTGVITDADGTKRQLAPGSILTLPKGWSGRWDITSTLRKVYVIVA
jgi:uncharacterized cupin superfamily protein